MRQKWRWFLKLTWQSWAIPIECFGTGSGRGAGEKIRPQEGQKKENRRAGSTKGKWKSLIDQDWG